MSPTRLFLSHSLQAEQRYILNETQSRYLARVLRLRVGDNVTVFDGGGDEYAATVTVAGKQAVELTTGHKIERDCESPLSIQLVQGISKGDRMDLVVQKATELGVARITPVVSEFTVVRPDQKRLEKKQQHWQRIAESACEQCGRNKVPAIDLPLRLRDWFGTIAGQLHCGIILRPGAPALRSTTEIITAMTLLVGPEGGFSDGEYEQAAAAGLRAVGLGTRILRTETAAIAAISLVQGLWGDMPFAD